MADETSDETTLPEPQDEATQLRERRLRRGRRVAYTVFYSMVVLFTLGSAAQITVQVYSPGEPWPGDCESGLRRLASSLDEAQRSSEGTDLGVEEALRRFRETIAPGWAVRAAVETTCHKTNNAALIEAFDALERLRYAEEIGVRRQAHDLAPLRRQARALVGARTGEPAPGSSGHP